jgi:hypothetical protein
MGDLAIPSSNVQSDLNRLIAEIEVMRALHLDLWAQARDLAARLAPAEPEPAPVRALAGKALRDAAQTWLAVASNHDVRHALVEARGAHSAAVLASKLNRDLVKLGCKRPLVVRNGHAHDDGQLSLAL